MAGKNPSGPHSEGGPRDKGHSASEPQQGPSGKDPRAKTFSCTNCGASIVVRYMGHSLSVVCESCKSVLDARDSNLRIIDKYFKVTKEHQPVIPLGSRGKLKGREWEVIGFMVRQDALSYYAWQEYLLFNPYYGYRWLTLNNGHWGFVTSLKRKPISSSKYFTGGAASTAQFDRLDYKLFYLGRARVLYVIGEFYWNVKVGTEVVAADYICPPYMISREGDDKEQVWSQSEYLNFKEVKEAFALEEMPLPIGIAPNQPTESKKVKPIISMLWVTFIVLLVCGQSIFMAGAKNEQVFGKSHMFVTNAKNEPITTPVFTLDKNKANIELDFSADVDNSWFYLYGELVNDDTDQTYCFEKTLEYYHGYSDGESWTEGSRHSNLLISSVPGGKYYMNLYTESGDFKVPGTSSFSVEVKRDVKTYANFFWCFLFLSFVPVIIWFRNYSDEVSRWSDSDFSPYSSSE